MNLKKEFYIYIYIRLDNRTPFYVGKGIRDRAKRIKSYSKKVVDIAEIYGYEIIYLFINLDEKEAFEKEIEYIRYYRQLGHQLANQTIGGEGSSGVRKSEQTKEKLINSMYKEVIDESTGKIWKGIKQAAKEIGIPYGTFKNWINGTRRNPTTYRLLNIEHKNDEQKHRIMGKGKIQSVKVLDMKTGKIWKSITEAAIDLKLKRATLNSWLCGNRPNNTTLRVLNADSNDITK